MVQQQGAVRLPWLGKVRISRYTKEKGPKDQKRTNDDREPPTAAIGTETGGGLEEGCTVM